MRVTMSRRTQPGRQSGLAVNQVGGFGAAPRKWCIQRWHATECGQRFDPPGPERYDTKREAAEARRRMLAGGAE